MASTRSSHPRFLPRSLGFTSPSSSPAPYWATLVAAFLPLFLRLGHLSFYWGESTFYCGEWTCPGSPVQELPIFDDIPPTVTHLLISTPFVSPLLVWELQRVLARVVNLCAIKLSADKEQRRAVEGWEELVKECSKSGVELAVRSTRLMVRFESIQLSFSDADLVVFLAGLRVHMRSLLACRNS